MTRALAVGSMLLAGCFNFAADQEEFCKNNPTHPRCSAAGGGAAGGGGSATGGGLGGGGGGATNGGGGGSAGGGAAGGTSQERITLTALSGQDFGDVPLNVTSSAKSFSIANSGPVDTGPLSVALLGNDAGAFILGDPCSTTTLTLSGLCTVTVSLRPRATGTQGATLRATSGAAPAAQLAVTGTGIAPNLTFNPALKNFVALNEGTMSTPQMFTVQNMGTAPSGPLQVALTGADRAQFEITSDGCTNLNLGNLGTCPISVRFNPQLAGPRFADLTLTSDAGALSGAPLDGISLGNLTGRVCDGGQYCQGGNCVDGYCCNSAQAGCNGCRACNVASSPGSCTDVPRGQDPHGTCTGVVCSTQACNGSNACEPADAGVVCADGGCVGAAFQLRRCSGTATGCPGTVIPQPCANALICASTLACKPSCVADSDCVAPNWCNGGTCAPMLQPGMACSRNAQCGYCIGGICRQCMPGDSCGGDVRARFCQPTGDQANRCDRFCGEESTPDTACIVAGLGATCTGGTFGSCRCTSSSQCTNSLAPSCLVDSNGQFCGCTVLTTGSPTGVQRCGTHMVCVANVADNYWASCKIRPGFLCSNNDATRCQSGACTDAGTCQ